MALLGLSWKEDLDPDLWYILIATALSLAVAFFRLVYLRAPSPREATASLSGGAVHTFPDPQHQSYKKDAGGHAEAREGRADDEPDLSLELPLLPSGKTPPPQAMGPLLLPASSDAPTRKPTGLLRVFWEEEDEAEPNAPPSASAAPTSPRRATGILRVFEEEPEQ